VCVLLALSFGNYGGVGTSVHAGGTMGVLCQNELGSVTESCGEGEWFATVIAPQYCVIASTEERKEVARHKASGAVPGLLCWRG